MFKNNFLKTLIVLVVLISSFSYNQVPACMDSLITNPFLKFSMIISPSSIIIIGQGSYVWAIARSKSTMFGPFPD